MKKCISLIVIMLLADFFFIPRVYADCDYSEKAALNKEVANIKIHYEEAEGQLPPSADYGCNELEEGEPCVVTYDYLKVSILNLSENFYIEASDSTYGQDFRFDYSQVQDGVITFNWDTVREVSTITYRVYSSDETNCPGEQFRVIYKTMPRRNPYASMYMCNDAPSSHTPCQKFVTTNTDPDYEDFIEGVEQAIEEQKEKEKKAEEEKGFFATIFNFLKENIVWVAVIVAVLAAACTAVIVILRRKHIL